MLSATELYADAMVENRQKFLLLMRCSKSHMENLIKEVIVENPIRNTVKNFDEITDNIKIQLNIRYMFSAMVAYTELWLEHYDEISKNDAVLELYRLCETPTLLFLDNFMWKSNRKGGCKPCADKVAILCGLAADKPVYRYKNPACDSSHRSD